MCQAKTNSFLFVLIKKISIHKLDDFVPGRLVIDFYFAPKLTQLSIYKIQDWHRARLFISKRLNYSKLKDPISYHSGASCLNSPK